MDNLLKTTQLLPAHPTQPRFWATLRKERNVKCVILTGLICSCICATVWCRVSRDTFHIDFHPFPITKSQETSTTTACEDGFVLIPLAFVGMLYLLYLIECWHSKAWVQLRAKKIHVLKTYQLLGELRRSHALILWKGVCYHYCRRRREVKHKGHSYSTRQIYYERINSHLEKGCFYSGFCGESDISQELGGLERHAFTTVRIKRNFLFANDAATNDFHQQKNNFFQELQGRDDYVEIKESFGLSSSPFGRKLEVEVMCCSGDKVPWFGRPCFFWTANFLLLSLPFRLILALNTAHINYQITKLFGTNYIIPPTPPPLESISDTNTPSPNVSIQDENEPLLKSEKTGKDLECKWEFAKLHPHPLHPHPLHSFFRKKGFSYDFNMKRSVTLLLTRSERDQVAMSGCDFLRLRDEKEQDDRDGRMGESGEGSVPSYGEALLLNGVAEEVMEPSCGHLSTQEITNPLEGSESPPPPYMEALQTSRPLFLPRWTSLRRCFTQRDLHSCTRHYPHFSKQFCANVGTAKEDEVALV